MISDLCKRRCCIYLYCSNDGNKCALEGQNLDTDDESLPCNYDDDEVIDFD